MEKQYFYFWCFLIVICCKLVQLSHSTESPQYTILHSQEDYEIRLYKETSWMSALVQGPTSFDKATKDGFHRLYQYIHGSNLDSLQLHINSPVLTSITSSANRSNYYVKYYLSGKLEGKPPQPSPELNLQVHKWKIHCMAIRKFSGFAKDDTIGDQVQALLNSLHKNTNVKTNGNSYTIAQYNAPNRKAGRLNEAWIDISGYSVQGCP